MQIKIFDVEHGFCALVTSINGQNMLIDCGHNNLTNFRPSNYCISKGIHSLNHLVVSNYDEDHLSDLPSLKSSLYHLGILHINDSINSQILRQIKSTSGPLGYGMLALLELLKIYIYPITEPIAFDGIEITHYFNNYPTFIDTNNLSVVTFLKYGDVNIIFPGDLEREGWLNLIRNANFVQRLSEVKIYVASHHGRESGYCKEIFDICNPYIVIVSDGAIQYDTQKDLYSKHSNGVNFPNGKRYVLTTRRDGHISISQTIGSVNISYSKYL